MTRIAMITTSAGTLL